MLDRLNLWIDSHGDFIDFIYYIIYPIYKIYDIPSTLFLIDSIYHFFNLIDR